MPFNLQAKGTSDGQQSHLESLELRLFDKPTLELAGDYSAAQFDLSMQLNQLPAELLHAAGLELPEGHFQGLLRLSGSPQQPQLNGDLQFATHLPVLMIRAKSNSPIGFGSCGWQPSSRASG